jgi:hypothetical protein
MNIFGEIAGHREEEQFARLGESFDRIIKFSCRRTESGAVCALCTVSNIFQASTRYDRGSLSEDKSDELVAGTQI